jgi:cell division protein FtsI (penicillin-binding protein 3)
VVSAEVAAEVRGFLSLAAGEGGTGSRAQLDRYKVIGKTGTARNVVGGTYTNSYTASFAGVFPADDPLLVAVVRIVEPEGSAYYGGEVAAPLMRRMLQDALAARRGAIDRSRFAERVAVAPDGETSAPRPASPLAIPVPVRAGAPPAPALLEIPDVSGASVRQAALALHRRGFRVQVEGSGLVSGSQPAPGDSARAGSVVTLRASGDLAIKRSGE